MGWLRLVVLLLQNLPSLLRIIEAADLARKESEVQGRIKDDLKAIEDAFKAGDAHALNRIFSGNELHDGSPKSKV